MADNVEDLAREIKARNEQINSTVLRLEMLSGLKKLNSLIPAKGGEHGAIETLGMNDTFDLDISKIQNLLEYKKLLHEQGQISAAEYEVRAECGRDVWSV
jgi:hypothetical protein